MYGWSPWILDIYSCQNFWNIVMAFKCMITTKTMIRFTSWICLVCTPLKLFCWYNGFKLILMQHSYSCPCELTRFFNEIFVQWCVFDKTYHPEPSDIPYLPYQVLNPKGGGGGSKCPIGQEIGSHFSQDHAMVTKILDFIHKHPN